LRSNG